VPVAIGPRLMPLAILYPLGGPSDPRWWRPSGAFAGETVFSMVIWVRKSGQKRTWPPGRLLSA